MTMTKLASARSVYDQLGLQHAPTLIDVRLEREFKRTPRLIPGAMYCDTTRNQQWLLKLPHRPVAVYASDDQTANNAANLLIASGFAASIIEGGIDRWIEDGLPTVKARDELGVPAQSQWVTRERPKIDRLACPWLIRRFIDPLATFHYVPAQRVRTEASLLAAQPYDIPDVTFSHRGPNCSFDAFLDEFELRDPIIDEIARIVRAADTATLDQSREAPGLLAISLGLSALFRDDQLLLEQAMLVYDALYAWCKTARDEPHSWPKPASAA
jgi:rhodanese-related sulfurtransferase